MTATEKGSTGEQEGPEYAQIRTTSSLLGLPIASAMRVAAHLVDGACDRASAGDLQHAIKLINELQGSSIEPADVAELHYYLANAWAGLRSLRHRGQPTDWQWKQPEMEQELLALRRAAHSDGFAHLQRGRRAQILTNAGNLVNTIGRSLEAIPLYDEATRHLAGFGMAMANRGIALKTLAQSHYDDGQAFLLLHRAWHDLSGAPTKHLEPGAESCFRSHAQEIESLLTADFLAREDPNPRVSLGKSNREREYRRWALDERLFLNPLISLGSVSCAARDTLNLPSIMTAIGEGPGLLGMFTQIKQEFVSARFLAWEGASAERSHFSDRETHLVDTLDYAVYGLSLEKTKLAFRMAYSILDKCAFLLNKYFAFGIDDRMVNLNRVWFTAGDPKKPLTPAIVDTSNWPLRGLFCLSRDLHDKDVLRDALEPDAQDLKTIRDHLEHKYLKVHDVVIPAESDHPDSMRDQYAKSVGRQSLESKTVALLRLARSAITYLSLGIHAEERKRALKRPKDAIVPMIFLPKVEDGRKR